MNLTSLLIALLICKFSMASSDHHEVFDKPSVVVKYSLGKSQDAEGLVELNCWAFNSFAIAEIDDPAIKGAKEIFIRYVDSKKSKLCTKDFSGKSISLENLAGEYVFQGAKGKYLFFQSADSFGDQLDFKVLNSENRDLVLSSTRNDSQNFSLVTDQKGLVSLRFYLSLKVPCQLAKIGDGCWKKTLSENKVPSNIEMKKPDCKESFKKGKSPLDNNALVSVPVEIPDLSKQNIVFLKGVATCDPAP